MSTETSATLTIRDKQYDQLDQSIGLRELDLINQFEKTHSRVRVEPYVHPPLETDNDAKDLSIVSIHKNGKEFKLVYESKLPAPDKFISLQKWEGIVTEIGEDYFIARIIDLIKDAPEESASFPFSEISSEEDKELLKIGAVFYWNIGYYERAKGTRLRSSLIRFRRLPMWAENVIGSAQKEAERLNEFFGWK